MSYSQNRMDGDKLLPQVKAILGQIFYRDDLDFEDKNHNTDLTASVESSDFATLKMGGERFGVRLRRYYAYKNKNWRHQFTIRYKTSGGHATEFDKIIYNDWGDYFFYGFMNEKKTYIIKWIIGDYDAFRVYVWHQLQEDPKMFIARHIQSNYGDNDSDFLVFGRDEIPGFVIADSEKFTGFGNCWEEKVKYLDPADVPQRYQHLLKKEEQTVYGG